ncbi:hypothetical protein M011DRAFT_495048 [Sporormia fimetaria CBS 119925]|uniref:Enhancer of mRNA-decapping protein 3 n=1 Tax=Sporormia fimetaria CBS 119925 TaxID=1340428 RepID=A0A6A6VA94_9PLEO|nr:hypothetical protein M011DRAFT_495048 [Sporormia fimetaria CBS 119925]
MDDSSQPHGSIKSRIAALNLEEVHAPAPGARPVYTYEKAQVKKKAPPPPPPSRPGQQRVQSVNNPPIHSNVTTATSRERSDLPISPPPEAPRLKPALPPRPPPRSTPQAPPSLPPRKASEPSVKKRESTESISTLASFGSTKTSVSGISNGGSLYQIRAPAYDPSKLPPIISKKQDIEEKPSATLGAMRSKTNIVADRALPPQLPARPPPPARKESQPQENNLSTRPRLAPPPQRSALSFGMNKSTEIPPPVPVSRPRSTQEAPVAPPPIPLASRPNLAAIMASKPRPSSTTGCLKCRDFSAPDKHAAQFPRQSLPNSDVAWLAEQLTSPFPSHTDKARAIFTWLHHNVDYDIIGLRSGNVKRQPTPSYTITSGLAVCEGYASLFAALALKAGVEAIVVSGHGKGAGHTPLQPGQPLPECQPRGHAWNAVRIDDGEWKLIDPCWGAGNVCGDKYNRAFKASWFTMDNQEFGFRHFPSDNRYFFRTDGRATFSWEEYWNDDRGGRLTVYGDATREHGLGERTFQPAAKRIKVHHDAQDAPVVRFQFATVCPHWDHERNGKGKPYLMVLRTGGKDGREGDWVPFQTDGRVWWLDVNRVDLGTSGQKVSVFAVTSFDGKDGRGLRVEEYKEKQGRVAMSWNGVCSSSGVRGRWIPMNLRYPTLRVCLRLLVNLPSRCPNSPHNTLPNALLNPITCSTMASDLIGISVAVTLRNPPNTVVEGLVANINAETSLLTLRNVLFPATGHRLDNYHVEGHAIADIKVSPEAPPTLSHSQPHPTPSLPPSGPEHGYHGSHHDRVPAASQPLHDPAIVSVKKAGTAPSFAQASSSIPLEAPATPVIPMPRVVAPQHASGQTHNRTPQSRPSRETSAATLEKPFSSLIIAEGTELETDEAIPPAAPTVRRVSITKTRNGRPMDDIGNAVKAEDGFKRTRRGGKARKKELAAQERRTAAEINVSMDTPRKGKDNGWRKTPLLQDAGQPATKTPGVIAGSVGLKAVTASNRKTRRQRALDATNGWATEDATDIQELPEFDFMGNLSKFDKRRVFEEIRNEDTTADEDRLVSFNRLARPGTHGGKNLHPTENVLSSPSTTDEGELSDLDSGRNSRRALSRASHKRIPLRQGSGLHMDGEHQAHSGGPPSLTSRATRSQKRGPYASSSHATGSPMLGRLTSPPASPMVDSLPQQCLRLVSTNRKCHTITPGGMLAVEESAEVDYGLSEDIMAENAARGIVEVALTALAPGDRRLTRESHNSRPVVVVLAGNHRAGARAIAAARHLRERGLKVMVALLGFERTADWDRDIRRQVDLYVKLGGSVKAWQSTEDALKRLQAPPELIIDALLGRHKEFDALADEDRRNVLSIVGWANKSRANVLAVETPSGVGGSTGEVAILEGEPLEVRAKYIVCLGAPRSGLLKALQRGSGRDPEWLIWVVDIGINRPWRNAGIGGGKGIRFGDSWVVQVKLSESESNGLRA